MPRQRTIPRRITSCLVCGARDQCMTASHLWGVRRNKERLRQVIDEIRYNKYLATTKEMEEGIRAHEFLEQKRSVEKDVRIVVDKINERSQPFYFTATFCSPTFGGLRCQPDAIHVETNQDELRLLIIEDKTTNQPRYYTQLYAEAVILTDRHCLIAPAFEKESRGIGGLADQKRSPFYTQLNGFDTFVVEATLNPYGSLNQIIDNPLKPIRFSSNFHILSEAESKYFAVTQSKKVILNALRHPQYVETESSAQMKFTRKGKELKVFLPKDSFQ